MQHFLIFLSLTWIELLHTFFIFAVQLVSISNKIFLPRIWRIQGHTGLYLRLFRAQENIIHLQPQAVLPLKRHPCICLVEHSFNIQKYSFNSKCWGSKGIYYIYFIWLMNKWLNMFSDKMVQWSVNLYAILVICHFSWNMAIL